MLGCKVIIISGTLKILLDLLIIGLQEMPLKGNKNSLVRQIVLLVQVSVHIKIKLNDIFGFGANLSSCIHRTNGIFLLMQDPCSCYEKKVKILYLWYNSCLLWEISQLFSCSSSLCFFKD